MAQEKIFAGKGKKKNDTWLQVTVNPDIINQHIQEFEGKKYVKLNINIGAADKFGKDVQISIDTWKPEAKQTGKAEADETGDLPF
jgi:hypothetical protein